jgi:hypothetical protein
MKQKLINAWISCRNFWYSLPHQVQAGMVLFATAAVTTLGQSIADGCWGWTCLKHAVGPAIAAGVIAVRTFYMRPGPGPNGRLQKPETLQ